MNKKIKILAFALYGVILSSGLTFTNVQAASVKNGINPKNTLNLRYSDKNYICKAKAQGTEDIIFYSSFYYI